MVAQGKRRTKYPGLAMAFALRLTSCTSIKRLRRSSPMRFRIESADSSGSTVVSANPNSLREMFRQCVRNDGFNTIHEPAPQAFRCDPVAPCLRLTMRTAQRLSDREANSEPSDQRYNDRCSAVLADAFLDLRRAVRHVI